MTHFVFTPRRWPRLRAKRDEKAMRDYISRRIKAAEVIFKARMLNTPIASSPGQYPAVRSGGLLRSIRTHAGTDEGVIGSNAYYSKYLREGTRFMKRRRMSDDALRESGDVVTPTKGMITWHRSR